jgi:hypothetical protein
VDGRAIVQVEEDAVSGGPMDIMIGGQKVNVSLGQRPRVLSKENQNSVAGSDLSLSQLQWPDGKTESFAFGTDDILNPTLAITHPDQAKRNFTWDANTKQIKSDGEWSYLVTPIVGTNDYTINRTSTAGLVESFSNDRSNGTITEQGLDGKERITRFFTSGILAGRIRSVEETVEGVTSKLYQVNYDEEGRPIREIYAIGISRTYDYGKVGWVKITTSLPNQVTRICEFPLAEAGQATVSLSLGGQDVMGNDSSANNSLDAILKLFGHSDYNIVKNPNGNYTLQ